MIELWIGKNGDSENFQIPVVQDNIELSLERRSTPGKLTFKVIPDSILDMSEGSQVQLTVNGQPVFFGYVFKQQRSKDGIITVTAYDQIRYLKNKDTKNYVNTKASELLQSIATEFNLKTGLIEDTRYVIPFRNEMDTGLLEMIETALDLTLRIQKEMYVLYDDFGNLVLKNITNMYVVDSDGNYLMMDAETGENLDYISSIDDNTYNKIKLTYDNDKTGKRDVWIAQDSTNMNQWGVLQYHESLDEGEDGQAKADGLLELYNKKTRNLKITKAFGDIRVRAGSMIVVCLSLGDMKLQNFMLVERVRHTFAEGAHWMDLTLRGGEFVGG